MKRKTKKRWSNKEVAFLKENYRELANKEIGKKINRSRISICHKATRIGLKKDRYIPLKKLPSSAKKPTEILAWLVGYLLGDGYLTTNWTIGMKSKDTDLKEFYIKNFERWSKFKKEEFVINREEGEYNDKEKGEIYNCEKRWVIRICSKDAWQFFKKFKDNPLQCLKFFPKEYWKFILKGLWDAEGSITPRKGCIEVSFSNSNENLITLYRKLCLSLGYNPRKYEDHQEMKIRLHRMKEVIDFVERIGVTVQRKQYKIGDRLRTLEEKMKKNNERMEIYLTMKKLKENGMKRKKIWERINRKIPLKTFDH